MCPSEFGRVSGVILIILALLGTLHVLGPTGADSLLGARWWIDWVEVGFYLVAGILLLGASFLPGRKERPVMLISGWLFLFLSIWGFFVSNTFLGMNIEATQALFYLTLFVWALFAGLCKESSDIPGIPV